MADEVHPTRTNAKMTEIAADTTLAIMNLKKIMKSQQIYKSIKVNGCIITVYSCLVSASTKLAGR